MGNLCIRDNDIYEKFEKKRCLKCQDRFIPDHGGFSKRKSCRYHNYINNVCIDCNKNKNEIGHTCYHQMYS